MRQVTGPAFQKREKNGWRRGVSIRAFVVLLRDAGARLTIAGYRALHVNLIESRGSARISNLFNRATHKINCIRVAYYFIRQFAARTWVAKSVPYPKRGTRGINHARSRKGTRPFSIFQLWRVERFLPENDDDRDLIDVTYSVTRFAFRSGRRGAGGAARTRNFRLMKFASFGEYYWFIHSADS